MKQAATWIMYTLLVKFWKKKYSNSNNNCITPHYQLDRKWSNKQCKSHFLMSSWYVCIYYIHMDKILNHNSQHFSLFTFGECWRKSDWMTPLTCETIQHIYYFSVCNVLIFPKSPFKNMRAWSDFQFWEIFLQMMMMALLSINNLYFYKETLVIYSNFFDVSQSSSTILTPASQKVNDKTFFWKDITLLHGKDYIICIIKMIKLKKYIYT